MIIKIKYILVSFLLLLFCNKIHSQDVGLGADVIYNLQSENIGVGARVNFFPNNRLSFAPEFTYFSLYDFIIPIKEYTIGLAVEYKFLHRKKVTVYAIAHGGYNAWLNFATSPMIDAQKNNWNAEGGLGITNSKCLRPFLEYRYSAKFKETQLRLGFLYILGCKPKKGSGRNTQGVRNSKRAERMVRCAAYDF